MDLYSLSDLYFKLSYAKGALLMYHGSRFRGINNDFSNYRSTQPATFFTFNKRVAENYSKLSESIFMMSEDPGGDRTVHPTVYLVEILSDNFFDMRKEEHIKIYQEIRSKEIGNEDFSWRFPNIKSEGFISTSTGLPAYPILRVLKKYLIELGFDGMWVDEGASGISLGIFNPQGKVRILETF